MIKKAQLTGGW